LYTWPKKKKKKTPDIKTVSAQRSDVLWFSNYGEHDGSLTEFDELPSSNRLATATYHHCHFRPGFSGRFGRVVRRP
jgi:hypothetical protein